MLKLYDHDGLTFQYEEGRQPRHAVEHVEAVQARRKQATPKNKSRKAADKAAGDA